MKTYSMKESEINNDWVVIDLKNAVLGRAAVVIARMLRGKHKPEFTPSMPCGDKIIVLNADKAHMTGKKGARHAHKGGKLFYWHTGYAGGIKSRTLRQQLEGPNPEDVIKNAVKRMLPKTNLGRAQLKNLFVYLGDSHPHQAQQPTILDISVMNQKNMKRS